MTDVFGFRPGQPFVWFDKNPAKSNQHCLYCGVYVGAESQITSNKEHLIGRNFVPKGSLEGHHFNFIFRACQECNNLKSVAERHVSSVTLFNSPGRLLDNDVDMLALHKASRDYHPKKKGVLVKDAHDQHTIELGWAGANARFDLVGPPQLDDEAVYLLACKHIQGIFSLISTEDPRVSEKTRLLPTDRVRCFGCFIYRDWGNSQLMEVARRSMDWTPYANIVSANGYFKLVVKERKTTKELFWALEWNKFLRVIGVICPPTAEPDLFSNLPELNWRYLSDGWRSRREIPLSEGNDILFPPVTQEGGL